MLGGSWLRGFGLRVRERFLQPALYPGCRRKALVAWWVSLHMCLWCVLFGLNRRYTMIGRLSCNSLSTLDDRLRVSAPHAAHPTRLSKRGFCSQHVFLWWYLSRKAALLYQACIQGSDRFALRRWWVAISVSCSSCSFSRAGVSPAFVAVKVTIPATVQAEHENPSHAEYITHLFM